MALNITKGYHKNTHSRVQFFLFFLQLGVQTVNRYLHNDQMIELAVTLSNNSNNTPNHLNSKIGSIVLRTELVSVNQTIEEKTRKYIRCFSLNLKPYVIFHTTFSLQIFVQHIITQIADHTTLHREFPKF